MPVKSLSFLVAMLLLSNNVYTQNYDVVKLIGAMLSETPIEEDLQELCDDIGGRVTGSEENKKAVEWAHQKFIEAGVKVERDPFQMPSLWMERSSKASISGSTSFEAQIAAKSHTRPGNYNAQLVNLGKGQEADFKSAGNLEKKFIIVESEICYDIGGLFAEYAAAHATAELAAKHQVGGVIYMSSRPQGLLYRFITNKGVNNKIPQLIMAREDAKRVIRSLQNGGELTIDIEVDAIMEGSFESHNVIAEIKGSTYPNEIVVIGSHIDSWALGTGANDNGCNVSMMIDIARQMKKLNIQPKRTIRFALWNGEEQGYFGSWDYVKDHKANLDQHIMAMSVDIGSGPIIGFFTGLNPALNKTTEKLLEPVQAFGPFGLLDACVVGTDNYDFMMEGVANLVANHKPASYGTNYHASSDTFDKVDLLSLKKNSAIIAALTLGFANLAPEDITWKRLNSEEMKKLVDESGLEAQMRMFDVWDPYIKGKRGRN
ncbi:MAG: M20/M25/M40 family metallo-hydrolase [Bacteroidota bacterium]